MKNDVSWSKTLDPQMFLVVFLKLTFSINLL